MTIAGIPILGMLKTKMLWHQERQRLLSENVANADTPNFKPSDLTAPTFDSPVGSVQTVSLARTSSSHLGSLSGGGSGVFRSVHPGGAEVRPAGNAVNLEDQMLKVAENQMDYQAAAGLYTKSLGLMKTALGKR